MYRLEPIYHFWHFLCVFCVFRNEDFLCAFFAKKKSTFWIFVYIFLHFLLSGAVCVVDLSDIDNIRNDQYGENYNIGSKQYTSKNLLYCPTHRFLELIRSLKWKSQRQYSRHSRHWREQWQWQARQVRWTDPDSEKNAEDAASQEAQKQAGSAKDANVACSASFKEAREEAV